MDVVIVSTGWSNHVLVALYAMEKGVTIAMEVGGTHSIEDCWKLVDCYERTKTPFMFLENCCYNKDEALATSLVRNGVLGNISFCQGYYCHYLCDEIAGGIDTHHYRLKEYTEHNCENYPTHELGPIAKILNINGGNRFVSLVSMASKAQGLKEFIARTDKYRDRLGDRTFNQGDVVTTMIKCENGETIFLKLDTTLPRLYERGMTVSGTKGFYCQTTNADSRRRQVQSRNGRIPQRIRQQTILLPIIRSRTGKTSRPKRSSAVTAVWTILCFAGSSAPSATAGHAHRRLRRRFVDVRHRAFRAVYRARQPFVEFPDFTRGQYKTRKPRTFRISDRQKPDYENQTDLRKTSEYVRASWNKAVNAATSIPSSLCRATTCRRAWTGTL
ncbi:MAG: hypothetical protein ACLUSP_07140 [Christensenellales bacterium]